jgi:hypothetical protein
MYDSRSEVLRKHPSHLVECVLLRVNRERRNEAAELPLPQSAMNLIPLHRLACGLWARAKAEDLDFLIWLGEFECLDESNQYRVVRPEPSVDKDAIP